MLHTNSFKPQNTDTHFLRFKQLFHSQEGPEVLLYHSCMLNLVANYVDHLSADKRSAINHSQDQNIPQRLSIQLLGISIILTDTT